MKKIAKLLSVKVVSIISVFANQSVLANGNITVVPAVKVEAKEFISAGEEIDMNLMGFKITAPKDWTVKIGKNNGPMIVMEEPKEKVDPATLTEGTEKTVYQRNITLAVKHQGVPVDEAQLKIFNEELQNTFGKNPILSNFSVIESNVVAFKDDQKAILVYTSFTMGKSQLMQMHYLTSNESKQYLQTYTDLAERFKPEDAGFSAAWASMNTLSYEGKSIVRYQDVILYSSIGGGILVLLISLVFLKKRSDKRKLENDAEGSDSDYSDESSEEQFDGVVVSNFGDMEVSNVRSIANHDLQDDAEEKVVNVAKKKLSFFAKKSAKADDEVMEDQMNDEVEEKETKVAKKKLSFFSKKSAKKEDEFADDLDVAEEKSAVSFVSSFN